MPAGNPIVVQPSLDTCLDNPLARDGLCLSPQTQNVLIRDREFQTRPGLNQLGDTFNERVLGSIWLRDLQSTTQLIIGTASKWRRFNNANQVWVDLSGGVPLSESNIPITFAYFFENGAQYVIGVNETDPTKEYNLAGSPGSYTNLAGAPIARSVCVVASRLMFFAIKIGAQLYPQTVKWSQAGIRTSYPALAQNDVGDTSDHIMCGLNLGRRAAAIMKEESQWLALSQPGSDASAFEFQLIDSQPGPVGPAAADKGPGGLQVVYLGTDLNIRAFDGVKGTIVKATQKYLRGRFNYPARSLTSVKYYPGRQEIWCAVALDTDSVPTHLMVYSYLTDGVYLAQTPDDIPISHLGGFQAEFETVTDALPDIPTDELPDVPTDQLGVASRGQELLAGSELKAFAWEGQLDDGHAISNDWQIVLPVIPRQEYEFDGVELDLVPSSSQILTVSVLAGQTYDTLTETPLGTIVPTDAPVFGETVSLRRPDDQQIRARVVIVKFSGLGSFILRRCEIWAWPRGVMA